MNVKAMMTKPFFIFNQKIGWREQSEVTVQA